MDYREKYEHWLEHADAETRSELADLDEGEIYDRFYTDMAFGTAGLRGIIGAGTNRLNKYTIRKTTAGLANYIKEMGPDACRRGIVIAHDNRRKSDEFSIETAKILAANGITAYLFDSLRPTPELSFAVRYLRTAGGVMITASHNPPEYNGYKVYDANGCQLVERYCDRVTEKIGEISDELAIVTASEEQAGKYIKRVPDEVDEKYYDRVMSISLCDKSERAPIKAVYSPQHGTGNIPVRTVLKRQGYDIYPVLSQCEPDPDFSGTESPNPEIPAAYKAAVELAEKENADIAITTDPDCDRLGVAVLQNGSYLLMTGNQSAAVILRYILEQRTKKNLLPQNAVMINTVVTSDLGDRICEKYGVKVVKTLTGFKYIGDKIAEYEKTGKYNFVFGYEESYGCLISDFVRDKDAVQASLMLCEAAAYYKKRGKTLYDALNDIYREFGYTEDALDNIVLKGADGPKKTAALLQNLRENPPASVGGLTVTRIEDFETEEMANRGFPKSNVLKFIFDDGSWCAVRPSGTEPKCKYYYGINAPGKKEAAEKLESMRETFEPRKI